MINEHEVTPHLQTDFNIGLVQENIEAYEAELLTSEGRASLSTVQTLIKLY